MSLKEIKSTSSIICIEQIIDEVLFDNYSFVSTTIMASILQLSAIHIFKSTSVVTSSFAMVEELIPASCRSFDFIYPLSIRSFHNLL